MNDSVIELAKALLERPSITPDDAGCQALLTERLSALGMHCQSLRFGDVDNLWARLGNHGPLIVFAGHTDVVPTGPLDEWESPPFEPTLRDGKLYARGACDMKGAIAAMVVAVEQFTSQHKEFNGSIGFLITSDEEGDAIHGTQKVMEWLNDQNESMDYCIVGEPSSLETIGDQIRIGRRGSLHASVTIHGKQGHVAHPHLAQNPIFLAAPAISELAQTIWDQGNEHYPPTGFQISNLTSGTGALNVIPGTLHFNANFRFSTALTPEMIQAKFTDILDSHNINHDIAWNLSAKPFLTQQGTLLNAAQNAITKVTGSPARCSTGGGTSDGRFIAAYGVEVIELGVPNLTAHQVNEWVNPSDLITLTDLYRGILENVLLPT